MEAELIFVPYPTPGHILVTIEFAKSLIKRDTRIHTITILLWTLPHIPHVHLFAKSLIASETQIHLVSLPDVPNPPPLELYSKAPEAYFLQFTEKMIPFVRDAISTLVSSRDVIGAESVQRISDLDDRVGHHNFKGHLETLDRRCVGVVLDFFCVCMIEVANEFNLPSYVFLTCNAGFLGLMKYLPERERSKNGSVLDLKSDEEHSIPGYVCSVPTKVFPSGQFVRESYEIWVKTAKDFYGAKGILVNSYTSLEKNAFEYFANRPDNYPPVYPVGPVLSLVNRANPDEDQTKWDRIMRWLENQPESSVVFLCFGSYGILPKPQIEEIAGALELVDHRFLWSIRTEKTASLYDLLPEGFIERTRIKGLVCDWAPQVDVLAHKAIGGFISHCGWNSVLESLWFGVPIATWPMYAEQQLNAFMLVKELGLAVELSLDYVTENYVPGRKNIVKAREIAEAIRSLMESEDTPRRSVKEMAEAARMALIDGGSSSNAIKRFIQELLGVE